MAETKINNKETNVNSTDDGKVDVSSLSQDKSHNNNNHEK